MTDIEDEDEVEQTFKFDQLSDGAKETARDKFRERDYPYDDWWDDVYEDFDRVATIMGVEIEMSTRNSAFGKHSYAYPHIYFSGFWSQGDGASFEGTYRFNAEATEKIRAYCNDEELFRIADKLALIWITGRLQDKELPYRTKISTSNNGYSHSGNMSIEGCFDDDDGDIIELDDIQTLMRDLADWLYKHLEAEYDHLTSDEVVDEYLAEDSMDFDVDGNLQS